MDIVLVDLVIAACLSPHPLRLPQLLLLQVNFIIHPRNSCSQNNSLTLHKRMLVNQRRYSFIIAEDFNLHVDDSTCLPAMKLLSMMNSFCFHQYVTDPTHDRGYTLGLVFAKSDDDCGCLLRPKSVIIMCSMLACR